MSTLSPGSAFAGDSVDALRWCQRYSRRHGENFTVVSWFLPRELRSPMFAVYAFCRFTDNLGDDPDANPAQRLERLEAWHADLERAFDGSQPRHPINVALQHVAAASRCTPIHFAA